jgi:hypothetical protein
MNLKYLLLLVILTFSCKSQDKDLYKFDPRNLTASKIFLSDIADEIKYIQLDNSFPHGEIYTYKILDSSIYISTKDIGIMELTRDGKFLRTFGAPGRGPGEYHYFWQFDVDPYSKSVYLLDYNVIKVYSKTGQFLRSIQLNGIDQEYFHDLWYYNSKLLISNYIVRGNSKYSWLVLDTTGIIVKKKYNPVPAFITNMESNGGNYLFNNNIYYWEIYNDTIYSISPDFSYKASFLFSPGDYRWPKNPISTNNFRTEIRKFYRINLIIETLKYRIVQVWGDYVLIDKESNTSYKSESQKDDKMGGFINDLDGGMLFQPRSYFTEKGREYLVAILKSSELITFIKSSDYESNITKNTEQKRQFGKFVNGLKETDNEIIMVVRLKK